MANFSRSPQAGDEFGAAATLAIGGKCQIVKAEDARLSVDIAGQGDNRRATVAITTGHNQLRSGKQIG